MLVWGQGLTATKHIRGSFPCLQCHRPLRQTQPVRQCAPHAALRPWAAHRLPVGIDRKTCQRGTTTNSSTPGLQTAGRCQTFHKPIRPQLREPRTAQVGDSGCSWKQQYTHGHIHGTQNDTDSSRHTCTYTYKPGQGGRRPTVMLARPPVLLTTQFPH